MIDAAAEGYRAAARQTIEIISRHMGSFDDRATVEAVLEENYPFWTSGGLARKAWRKEARRFMAGLGFRPRPRHELLRAHTGETRRERAVVRHARRMQ